MTESELVLARRVVKAPGWRWLAGMRMVGDRTDEFGRITMIHQTEGMHLTSVGRHPELSGPFVPGENSIPDLGDHVTCAALAVVARAAWGDDALHSWPTHDIEDGITGWTVRTPLVYGSRARGDGLTEAAAWVACIEAAPRR